MKNLLLVLGAPNDDEGNLSDIALDRLNCAYEFYKYNEDVKIMCTGGFGKSFNTTNKPHAFYSQTYLKAKGVPEGDLLPYILSANTVDDFRMSKDLILSYNPSLLLVITSDFHMARVKILHQIIVNYSSTRFIPAKSSLSESDLIPLIRHEKKAIQQLKENNYQIY